MPKVPDEVPLHSIKGAKALRKVGRQLAQPTAKRKEEADDKVERLIARLHEHTLAMTDLSFEMQNLNGNLGKLYDQFKKYGIPHNIPDDDVPF